MESRVSNFETSFYLKNRSPTSTNKKTLLQTKVKNIQLQKDLKAIAKADEIDLRLQQAEELQFRRKYEKYLTRGNFETSLIRKDNFKKVAKQNLEKHQSGEVVPLHKLIYTKGEVDVEKVMCLHLLSVQYMDCATFTGKRNLKLFSKRSKPNMLEASVLPFYILEAIHLVDTELKTHFREGQDVILLVNTNLEKLVLSILEVLAIVSPTKLQQIQEISLSRKLIQELMIKTKMFNLLSQVKESPVLLKMSNYRLEVAQFHEQPSSDPNVLSVCRVQVKDKSKKIELIQNEINKAISKYMEEDITTGESWSMFHKRLCSCRKAPSVPSMTAGNAIALLSEDGRGFAVVTGSGCHLPTRSSIFCPSLTAIIKSSPHSQSSHMTQESSGYLLMPKYSPFLKNDQNFLISSILHKVKNSSRILIGKKAAEYESQKYIKTTGKQKIPIKQIMEDVFTKESLISLASSSDNEELKLMFQPCCKGGLGMGSFFLKQEREKPTTTPVMEELEAIWNYDGVVPQIIQQEKSIMHTAMIKQEIFTSETRTKMKQFLQSNNPGKHN